MKFRYTQYPLLNGEYIFRPSLPVILRLGAAFLPIRGIIDSGSDLTILPISVARFFKLNVSKMHREVIQAVGGNNVLLYQCNLRLEHIVSSRGFRDMSWKCPIYFSESQSFALLGQKGFFDHLDVNLSWRRKEIEITM